MSNTISSARRFLTRKQQAQRWSKTVRTVERWGANPKLGLPAEYDFNGKPHREESELELWEDSHIRKGA
jgi:hypothetical protein